jgi:hypothetical protein
MAETVSKATSASASDEDDSWVQDLLAADQVAYRKARLAWRQAHTKFEADKAAAAVGRYKPQKDFEAAKGECAKAEQAKKEAKAVAQTKKEAIAKALEQVKPDDADDPNKSSTQLSALQAAIEDYKTAVGAVAKRQSELEAANSALIAKSDSSQSNPNPDAVQLALDQYELDVATAEIPWQAANHAFHEAAAGMKSRRDRLDD